MAGELSQIQLPNSHDGLEIWREIHRPWKLLTLAIGIFLLIAGSFYYQAPD